MKFCAILACLAVALAQEIPTIPEPGFVKTGKYPFPNKPWAGGKYNQFYPTYPQQPYGPEYQTFPESGSLPLNFPTTITTTGMLRAGTPSTFTCRPREAVAVWDSLGPLAVLRCTPIVETSFLEKFGAEEICRWTEPTPISTGIRFVDPENCKENEYLAGVSQTIRGNNEPHVQLKCCQQPNYEIVPETCYTTMPELNDPTSQKNTPFGTPFGTPTGTPFGTPFGTPTGTPYGTPYGTPFGTPFTTPNVNPFTPFTTPYTNQLLTPYGTPYVTGRIQGRRNLKVPFGRELVHTVQINPTYETVIEYCVYLVKGQSTEFEPLVPIPPTTEIINRLPLIKPGTLTPIHKPYRVQCADNEAMTSVTAKKYVDPMSRETDVQLSFTCKPVTELTGRVFRRYTPLQVVSEGPFPVETKCTYNEYVCGAIGDVMTGQGRVIAVECCSVPGFGRVPYPFPNTRSLKLGVLPQTFTLEDPQQVLTGWSLPSSEELLLEANRFGPLSQNQIPYGPYGPMTPGMGPYGPMTPGMGPYGPMTPGMGPYGPMTPGMGPYGPMTPGMGPYGPMTPGMGPYGPMTPGMGPYGPMTPGMGPYGPMTPGMGPYGPTGPWTNPTESIYGTPFGTPYGTPFGSPFESTLNKPYPTYPRFNNKNFVNTPFNTLPFGSPFNTPYGVPSQWNPISSQLNTPYGVPTPFGTPFGVPSPLSQLNTPYGPVPTPFGVPTPYGSPYGTPSPYSPFGPTNTPFRKPYGPEMPSTPERCLAEVSAYPVPIVHPIQEIPIPGVFLKVPTTDLPTCALTCYNHPQCVSAGFVPPGPLGIPECHLSTLPGDQICENPMTSVFRPKTPVVSIPQEQPVWLSCIKCE